MNGHAEEGNGERDLAVDPYRPPLAWQRLKPANDNTRPLSQRVLRLAWWVAIAGALGWAVWAGFR